MPSIKFILLLCLILGKSISFFISNDLKKQETTLQQFLDTEIPRQQEKNDQLWRHCSQYSKKTLVLSTRYNALEELFSLKDSISTEGIYDTLCISLNQLILKDSLPKKHIVAFNKIKNFDIPIQIKNLYLENLYLKIFLYQADYNWMQKNTTNPAIITKLDSINEALKIDISVLDIFTSRSDKNKVELIINNLDTIQLKSPFYYKNEIETIKLTHTNLKSGQILTSYVR